MPETLTLPTPGTIKRKLFDDIAKGQFSPDDLRVRHGLNGHDLVKNLEQLRKEGFIHVEWGAGERVRSVKMNPGAVNMAVLNGHTRHPNERGDHASRVADAINRLPWQSNGWREWDRPRVVKETGLDGHQVGKALRVLRDSGRLLQLGGGGQGVSVSGVRWRGEQAPTAPRSADHVESALDARDARPSPSQALAKIHEKTREHLAAAAPSSTPTHYPESRKLVQHWHALKVARQALEVLDQRELLTQLENDPVLVLTHRLGPEVEALLLKAKG